MATSKNNTIKYLVVGGLLAYLLLKSQGSNQAPGNLPPGGGGPGYGPPYYNFPAIPSKPTTPQAIQNWVSSIIGTVGNVAALWQPGGPFYNEPAAPPPPGAWDNFQYLNNVWP